MMSDVTTSPEPRRFTTRGPAWRHGSGSKTPTSWRSSARPGLRSPCRRVFAFAQLVFSNPQTSLFGAFGSFALLLLVDFPGRPRTRLLSYLTLFVAGGGLICLGTAASMHKVASVVSMAVVGFVVLFAGIIAPQVAAATTAALLTFVLAGGGGPAGLGDRASTAGLGAGRCRLHPGVHVGMAHACGTTTFAAASQLPCRPLAGWRRRWQRGTYDPVAEGAVQSELSLLREHFAATPYPPTGAVSGAAALAKLVGRVEWAAGNAALIGHRTVGLSTARELIAAVADTLRHSAALICDGAAHPVDDPTVVKEVQESTRHLERLVEAELTMDVSALIEMESGNGDVEGDARAETTAQGRSASIASSLDPSFQARAFGIATEMVADASLEAAGAQAAGDRRLGAIDDVSSAPVRQSHHLAPFLSLRMVPQCRSWSGGAGSRGWRRRGDQRPAWLLGGARHDVRTAVQCSGHRCDCPEGHRRDDGWFRRGLGHHDRRRRSHRVVVGPAPTRRTGLGCGTVHDLLRGWASRLHLGGGDLVQYHSASWLESWLDPN